MPRPDLDQIRGIGEFATLYQWELQFAKFPDLVGDGGAPYPANEDLNLRCYSAAIPVYSTPRITTSIRGHQIHQPGPAQYEGSLTLTFMETIDNIISQFLLSWRNACTHPKTGSHGLKSEIEAIIKLTRLGRKNEAIWIYDIFGCWLESYTAGELGAEAAQMQPSMTIAYDYFTEQAA